MKRAFDIFDVKGKGTNRMQALDRHDKIKMDNEPQFKRQKKFEMSEAQKQRKDVFREVITYGEQGLDGEAAAAAQYRWKKSMNIPMKKVKIPYPELKKKLIERNNMEVKETVSREKDAAPKFTRAPVIAHKKPKLIERMREEEEAKRRGYKKKEDTGLQVMPGKMVKGNVHLMKRDISRIYDHVKKRQPKQPKKKDNKKKGGKKGGGKR